MQFDVQFHDVYFTCAAVGGTVLVLQTLLTLLGGHHDGDAGHDFHELHDAHAGGHGGEDGGHGDAFIKLFTLKSLVAFLTFFGLAGLAGDWSGNGASTTFVFAIGAGIAALVTVAWLMRALARLQSRGNVRLENAVGATARVYLRIPSSGGGAGKVTVAVQGRTVELKAVTTGAEIPTGATVRVVALQAADTVDVLPVADALP